MIRQDVFQDEESNPANEGAPVTVEQALYLEELVKEAKADRARFLKYAQAATFEEIAASKYDMLAGELHKRLGR